MDAAFTANLCLAWLCCLQPLLMLLWGYLMGRYGFRGLARMIAARWGAYAR